MLHKTRRTLLLIFDKITLASFLYESKKTEKDSNVLNIAKIKSFP